MPDSSDIDNALVAKLLADTGAGGVLTLMPDGVFFEEAGASMVHGGQAKQFVIVSLVDEQDRPIFEGRASEDALYLVKAVELSTVAVKNIKAAAARIDVLLDPQPPLPRATLTVPGFALMVMRRESRVRRKEVDALDASVRWEHRGGRYQLMVAPIGT